MVTITHFRKLALSFPESTENLHFEKASFSVKKKIFATYDDKLKRACFKLSETDQHIFSVIDPSIIFPVQNKWGLQGWTIIEMAKVDKQIFNDALIAAFCEVAPKKLAELVKNN